MSRKEIKTIAKNEFTKQWGLLLLVCALACVVDALAGIVGFGVGALITAGPLLIGIYYVYSSVIERRDTDWQDLFIGFRTMFADSFMTGALIILMVGVPAFVVAIAGSILAMLLGSLVPVLYVVIPLVMPIVCIIVAFILGCRYAEAPILLLKEPGITPVDALKKSRALMDGKKKDLIVFDLSFIGWFILGCFTAGVLFIYITPYYWYARTLFLREVYNEKAGIPQTESEEMTEAVYELPDVNEEPDAETDAEPDNVCKYCGAELPEGAAFCGICGKKQ